jgi:hypothetical protein
MLLLLPPVQPTSARGNSVEQGDRRAARKADPALVPESERLKCWDFVEYPVGLPPCVLERREGAPALGGSQASVLLTLAWSVCTLTMVLAVATLMILVISL